MEWSLAETIWGVLLLGGLGVMLSEKLRRTDRGKMLMLVQEAFRYLTGQWVVWRGSKTTAGMTGVSAQQNERACRAWGCSNQTAHMTDAMTGGVLRGVNSLESVHCR